MWDFKCWKKINAILDYSTGKARRTEGEIKSFHDEDNSNN
jgi:hypothetical protein